VFSVKGASCCVKSGMPRQARMESSALEIGSLEWLKHHVHQLSPHFNFEHVFNIYQWGSRVYGSATPQSDWDYIFVVDDSYDKPRFELKQNLQDIENDTVCSRFIAIQTYTGQFLVIEDDEVNVTFIPWNKWLLRLWEHRHEALECFFNDSKFTLLRRRPEPFRVDREVLRRTSSWESRARFRTAINKLKAGDWYRGKKEIVHMIRYRMLALQILQHNRIVDYTCANSILARVLADASDNPRHYKRIGDEHCAQLKEETNRRFGAHTSFYSKSELDSHYFNYIEKVFRKQISNIVASGHSLWISQSSKTFVSPNSCIVSSDQFEFSPVSEAVDHVVRLLRTTVETQPFTFVGPLRVMRWPSDVTLIHISLKASPSEEFHRFCNPIILRELESGDLQVICIPPPLAHSLPADIQPSSTHAIWRELIDGMQLTLYWNSTFQRWALANEWSPLEQECCVNWKSTIGTYKNAPVSVEELFWKLWRQSNYAEIPEKIDFEPILHAKSMCFTFKLSTNAHRRISIGRDERLVLVAVRDLATLKSISIEFVARALGFDYAKRVIEDCELSSGLQTVKQALASMSPFECAGYSIELANECYEMLSSSFVSAAFASDHSSIGALNLSGSLDESIIVEMLRTRVSEQFLEYFPHWRFAFETARARYMKLCKMVDDAWTSVRGLDSASFARAAQEFWFHFVLFGMRRFGAINSEQFFADWDIPNWKRCWDLALAKVE
jgi:hypothetical protein